MKKGVGNRWGSSAFPTSSLELGAGTVLTKAADKKSSQVLRVMILGKGTMREARFPPIYTHSAVSELATGLQSDVVPVSFVLDQRESKIMKQLTPSSSVPSALQCPCPCPASCLAKHSRRPNSPFPPTPDWIIAKLLNWGCLSPCQTLLTNLSVKAAVTDSNRKSGVKLISWKGPSQTLVLWLTTTGWVNSHPPQCYRCWAGCRAQFPKAAPDSKFPQDNLKMKHCFWSWGFFATLERNLCLSDISLQTWKSFLFSSKTMAVKWHHWFYNFFCSSQGSEFLWLENFKSADGIWQG